MNNLLGDRFFSSRYMAITVQRSGFHVSDIHRHEEIAIAEVLLDPPCHEAIDLCVLLKFDLTELMDVKLNNSCSVSASYMDELLEQMHADEDRW